MKKYLVAGRFGPKDKVYIRNEQNESVLSLNLIGLNKKLNYGIGNALEDLKKLDIFPTEIGVDLLVLAAHVYVADTRISRNKESQNSWTREIRIRVPVSDPKLWLKTVPTLQSALNFLTGDIWIVDFRLRPIEFKNTVPIHSQQLIKPPFDSLSLFSGGLDSLIGDINLLEKRKTPLLISHADQGSISDAQETCFLELKKYYKKNNFSRLRVWLNSSDTKIKGIESEKTTRGRSFLFFAIGAFAGTGFKERFVLYAPENGLIALNIPLDPLRLGAHSTRTTHPFYITKWNEVLGILKIPGHIENPFWDKTKGEMITDCSNINLLKKLIPSSLSCASPTKGRWKGHGVEHCGYCLPCVIRRAAILKGLGQKADKTIYSLKDLSKKSLNTLTSEGRQIRSFQYALARLKRKPGLANLLIHNSGPLLSESPLNRKKLAIMYVRGMNEVKILLKKVQTIPK